jgi:hypothetical protein
MSEIILTGLALLHIHGNIDGNVNRVTDRFLKPKKKLYFAL